MVSNVTNLGGHLMKALITKWYLFCPNIPFLTLAVMIFAFAELAMHLFFFNLSLKKWYNPGLLTTLVGLVPVSVYYLAHDWKLYSGLDWFLG